MNARGLDFTGIAYLAAIGVVAYVGYQVVKQGKQVGQAATDLAKKAVDLVNPASSGNIVNRVVNAPIEAATDGDTLGTWLASKSPTVAANEASVDTLSDYWKSFQRPGYLDALANAEQYTKINNQGITGNVMKSFGFDFGKDDPRAYADSP